MKDKNKKIPLYGFSYRTSYYLKRPWKFFRDLHILLKNAYHRMRYGYAWVDLWNTDTYLGTLIPNMLDDLATRSCGWPEGEDYPKPEDWEADLHVLARLWRIFARDFITDEDEMWEEFTHYRDRSILAPIAHLPFYNDYLLTEEECAAIDAAPTKWERIDTAMNALRAHVFLHMSKIWNSLWD